MSKEKLIKLTKYANDVKNKLSDGTLSEKQKNRPKQYKAFLERELAAATAKIDAIRVSLPSDKK
jgi:hypothetical protein